MNTTENNKLIAEFMGFKYIPNNDVTLFGRFEGNRTIREQSIKYLSDWNWIIDVAKECRKRQTSNMPINIMADIYDALHNCEIEHLYKAVLQFINYHNSAAK